MTARVVIADDEPTMLSALAELLTYSGIEVVGRAANGTEAVAAAADLHPDVVLMDLRMPGIDGIEASRRINAMSPDVQVLILTAYDDEQLRDAATDVGAYCYLVKGTAPGLILDMIARAKEYGDGLRRTVVSANET
jgi:DNA-binding NarL/FixJ family response regulator